MIKNKLIINSYPSCDIKVEATYEWQALCMGIAMEKEIEYFADWMVAGSSELFQDALFF